MHEADNSYVRVLQAELVQTRLQHQQLEEELEKHARAGEAVWAEWQGIRARVLNQPRQVYHIGFSVERGHIPQRPLPGTAKYEPYVINLRQPTVVRRQRVRHVSASLVDAEPIDVFSKVMRRPQTWAPIVGNGFYDELYRQKVAEAGVTDQTEFAGVVPCTELPNYYRRPSVFGMPAHKESFGQVTPFAMNMRIPVAACQVGALPEILGSEGVPAPAGNSAALADSIIRLLDAPARMRELGVLNQARAQQLFAPEAMGEACRPLHTEWLGQSQLSA